MRVEHDGVYAVVASLGGAPKHPVWYYNLKTHPHVELQDGATKRDYTAREVTATRRRSGGNARSRHGPTTRSTRPRRPADPGVRARADDVASLLGARLSSVDMESLKLADGRSLEF